MAPKANRNPDHRVDTGILVDTSTAGWDRRAGRLLLEDMLHRKHRGRFHRSPVQRTHSPPRGSDPCSPALAGKSRHTPVSRPAGTGEDRRNRPLRRPDRTLRKGRSRRTPERSSYCKGYRYRSKNRPDRGGTPALQDRGRRTVRAEIANTTWADSRSPWDPRCIPPPRDIRPGCNQAEGPHTG